MENIKLYRTVPSPLPLSGAGQGRPNSVPSWNLTLSRRQPGLGSTFEILRMRSDRGSQMPRDEDAYPGISIHYDAGSQHKHLEIAQAHGEGGSLASLDMTSAQAV